MLFCQKDTSLHADLRSEWELFTGDDPETVNKYRHLFPPRDSNQMKFVTFQQGVLKDRMPSITEEESCKVQELIDVRFEADTKLHENPWQAMKVDDTQDDADLQKRYLEG
jgi:hypothetical protein